jgi:hypothetical protein
MLVLVSGMQSLCLMHGSWLLLGDVDTVEHTSVTIWPQGFV